MKPLIINAMDVFFLFLLITLPPLYFITHFFLHKFQNLPITPFPTLPIIGHFHLLRKPFHRSLAAISRRYGPVVFLRFGSHPVLLVSSPSAAEECFTKNDVVFANRPRLLMGKHLGYNYTSISWAPYGDHWRNLRRIASLELLSSHRIQSLSHIRADEIRTLIRRLRRVSGDPTLNEQIDMRSALFELTFNAVTRMIMGKRYYGEKVTNSEEAKRFREMVKEVTSLAAETSVWDFLPFMRWFGFKDTEKKVKEVHEKRDKFMQNLIDEHRKMGCSSSSSDRKTIIEVLLELHESELEYYTDEAVRSLLLVLLQAGSDTSASTIEWAFYHLLHHPHVLKKAQAEIDDRVGRDRLINDLDLSELPYLRCIIKETLRLHPAASLLMPHQSSEECVVGGYRIPRGTMLLVNAWAIQRDPKIWAEAHEFKPERFEGVEGEKEGFKFMPFGSGRRGCPGEALAHRMIELFLGSLIQCFDWETGSEEETIDMSEGTGLTASRVKPLMATCISRPNMSTFFSQI